MSNVVHLALIPECGGYAYAACSLWTCKRVKVSMLRASVTCKGCKRTKAFKRV